ncbi:MAG: hypothetical protein GX153_07010 [Clostridiaceae bacterium]|nr:hypothetical protein [Clostridiaceae bacterium]
MRLSPIPASTLNTEAIVTLEHGQDPYGNAVTEPFTIRCRIVEKSEQRLDAERRLVSLKGSLYLTGDLAPHLSVIEGGTVRIGDREWSIYAADRPRNPDGTVHHTKLYLR